MPGKNGGQAAPGDVKKLRGQFYTISNPFHTDIFYKWMNIIPPEARQTILEPFAGSNNIVKMISDLGFESEWACFDISPSKSACEGISIKKRDTLKNFPVGYSTIITNPPYLAKNSAKRNGLPYPNTDHDDIYKLALEIMLDNAKYIASIIPESFATSGLFHSRLFALVSLPCKMFDDTDCPVCLALFIPANGKEEAHLQRNDFLIYSNDILLGRYLQLKSSFKEPRSEIRWKFTAFCY